MGWQNDPIVGARPKWESDPIVNSAPVLTQAVPVTQAIVLAAGVPVPQVFQPSANPYSAGFYPLARKYTVGDEATFRQSDLLTGVEVRTYTQRVTRVDETANQVDINDGDDIWDLMGNKIKSEDSVFDVPQQFAPAELQVGKKWTAAFRGIENGQRRFVTFDMQIMRREMVSVPAGSFDAFKVEGFGWNMTNGARLEERLWLVPKLNFYVRRERLARTRWNTLGATVRMELISVRQQVVSQ